MDDLVTCPVCFGERGFDMRDMNACLKEQLTDAQLLMVQGVDEDWHPCEECGETGLVTTAHARVIEARAVAAVDQVLAKLREEGALSNG